MISSPPTHPTIYYRTVIESGPHAPWLILVHGFTHHHPYFSVQIPEFQPDFRLCLPDLRGHGRSAELAGPYGIEEYADDLIAVLDAAGIEQTHYWGTHTGAAIGLVLALRQPHRFRSLILEGATVPGLEMPRVGELIDRAKSLAQAEGKEVALADWFTRADWFAYIWSHPEQCRLDEFKQLAIAFTGDPWLSPLAPRPVTPVVEALKTIRLPVLVYNGEADMPDFKRAATCLSASLPDVRREEIPEAGGFPAWENPFAVNQRVRRFLQTINYNLI